MYSTTEYREGAVVFLAEGFRYVVCRTDFLRGRPMDDVPNNGFNR